MSDQRCGRSVFIASEQFKHTTPRKREREKREEKKRKSLTGPFFLSQSLTGVTGVGLNSPALHRSVRNLAIFSIPYTKKQKRFKEPLVVTEEGAKVIALFQQYVKGAKKRERERSEGRHIQVKDTVLLH